MFSFLPTDPYRHVSCVDDRVREVWITFAVEKWWVSDEYWCVLSFDFNVNCSYLSSAGKPSEKSLPRCIRPQRVDDQEPDFRNLLQVWTHRSCSSGHRRQNRTFAWLLLRVFRAHGRRESGQGRVHWYDTGSTHHPCRLLNHAARSHSDTGRLQRTKVAFRSRQSSVISLSRWRSWWRLQLSQQSSTQQPRSPIQFAL